MILTAKEHQVNYRRVEEAIQYLQENFRSQPELDEVADKVHMSPFHFPPGGIRNNASHTLI